MADQDGGILQKILTMTGPPNTATTKQRRTKQPKAQMPATRQTGIDNKPYCEACGDGGDLLCCERCPSSFHFQCCDPPLDPLHLPEGEWVCQGCRPSPAHLEEHPNDIFRPLLIQCCSENPLVFTLPDELMNMVAVRDMKPEKKSKQDSPAIKFCYICNKSSRFGRVISCDFCPLTFHMDCLTPPLPDKPISSTWLCPNHVEHKIADLQDIRLTKRVEALEKCRAEISRQAIKMDFFKALNKIPAHQRGVTRTNRRASDVPMAIKALYTAPLTDSRNVPCLSDLLITATEELEVLRRETQTERQVIGEQAPPTITTSKDCDEWTRHAILSQAIKAPPTTKWANHNSSQSTVDDLKDLLGVSHLGNEAPPTCNGFSNEMELISQSLPKHCSHESTKLVNGLVQATPTCHLDNFIPDVDQLDNSIVKLLAEQRIKQLFVDRISSPGSSSHDSHMTTVGKQLNHAISKPHQSISNRTTNQTGGGSPLPLGILCPLSSYGPAHYLYKRIITIGSSSNMDISLQDYGHCNYVSAHHACLILDRDSSENELINYSEHGSIVDGVLYSCDFSDKMSNDSVPPLLLDDIIARGVGTRAEKARKRLDLARKCLKEKTQATKALTAAYKLSKSIVKDLTIEPSAVSAAGIKRRRSFDESSSSSPNSPGSSIVSIPLSKTKKTSNNRTNDKYSDSKKKSSSSPPGKKDNCSPSTPTATPTGDHKPCLCKRSASSLIGTGGKGWEGAATVSHGSKLRFGCIQLVISISNKPGYNELQQSLIQHKLL